MTTPPCTGCQEPAQRLGKKTSQTLLANVPRPALPSPLVVNCILQWFDFSDAATTLARSVAPLALRSDAQLRLLHIIEPTRVSSQPWTACGMALDSERAQFREKRLRAFIIEQLPPNLSVCGDVRIGNPADEVAACAASIGTDLLVMPMQVDAAPPRLRGRSDAERIIRRVLCPSLTISQSLLREPNLAERLFPSTWKRILVPVDCSCASVGALKFAATLAQRNAGSITILHVPGGPADSVRPESGFHDLALRSGQDRLAAWIASHGPLPVAHETIVRLGLPPSTAILLEARRLAADIIVLGLRPLRWPRRFCARRTADAILRLAECLVLSIPEAMLPPPSEQPQAA